MFKCRKEVILMSEQKRKIGFTVACVNEFANRHNLSSKEAFQYLFQFKGIAFIKENYDVEHTLDFDTILDDLGILCKKNGGQLTIMVLKQMSLKPEALRLKIAVI